MIYHYDLCQGGATLDPHVDAPSALLLQYSDIGINMFCETGEGKTWSISTEKGEIYMHPKTTSDKHVNHRHHVCACTAVLTGKINSGSFQNHCCKDS